MIKILITVGFGNLFSLISILYLNNYEDLNTTTDIRTIIIYTTTFLIFFCFGFDQYYPRFETQVMGKFFLIHAILLFVIGAGAGIWHFYGEVDASIILFLAALGAIIHLAANYERANHHYFKYLFNVHILSKLIIFFSAYFSVIGMSIEIVTYFLVSVIFFIALQSTVPNLVGGVSKSALSHHFLLSGGLAIATPFFLRLPYFWESFQGSNELLLNTQDILTTVFLLAFVPLQQMYKVREAKNKFRLGDYRAYNISETTFALGLIALLTGVLFYLKQHQILHIDSSQFFASCLVICAFYLAFFSARNAVQILVFSNTRIVVQQRKIVVILTIFASVGLVVVMREILLAKFILFCIPTLIGLKANKSHVNVLMFSVSVACFIMGRTLYNA